jgi:TatD DNase family protein
MMIDTHAHLNFNAYKDDSKEVIDKTLKKNIWMINVGSQYSTSRRAVEIAEKYKEGVYAAIGLHPIHLSEGIFKTKVDQEEIAFKTKDEDFDYEQYKELAKSKKVVAIGEIGMDYWYRPKTKIKLEEFKSKQKEIFLKQLELAKELNLPVVLHCRVAYNDMMQSLKEFNYPDLKGVAHCFVGSWQETQEYLNMGFYLGFNGIIFKLDLDEVIEKTPLDKILLETDCPYLTPSPMEGRNEPIYLKYIAEKIAKIKNISIEKLEDITTQNAKTLFTRLN